MTHFLLLKVSLLFNFILLLITGKMIHGFWKEWGFFLPYESQNLT
jgi:hypothetical protein